MRFVVALLHLVCGLACVEPLLVSLAVGSPAATSLATASSWHSSARPAQRRPAPLHPLPCRTQQGVGEVGEVVARWANLNALRGNSGTNGIQQPPTGSNGAQFVRHYTAAATRNRSTWAAAACPHHSLSHSVGTQSLAHSPHVRVRSHPPSQLIWLHLPPLRDQIWNPSRLQYVHCKTRCEPRFDRGGCPAHS